MFSIFGVVAIVLASVGIYGVMSFSVNQRTQEFGVRMALGAHHGRILQHGAAAGSRAAGARARPRPGPGAGRWRRSPAAGIQNMLFGVTARDPLTYAVVFALVTIVSLVATLVPARRATRVDPMIALRAE